jgi:hypothetical protein
MISDRGAIWIPAHVLIAAPSVGFERRRYDSTSMTRSEA